MPLYTCIADPRTRDTERAEIARAITDAHCRHTGAPPEFVHVFFNGYLGGDARSDLRIVGTIRSGRPEEVRGALHDEIVDRVSAILRSTPDRVQLDLQEITPCWSMEGGAVLPDPGDEAEWLRRHWSDAAVQRRGSGRSGHH